MGKKKILFVDDEETVLKWLKLTVERTGFYEAATAQDGRSALRAAQEFGPDLIFIDISMPDIEGSELAAGIRSQPALTRIPIVFLTGAVTSEEVDRNDGFIGGEYFLAKPVALKSLLACIAKRLGPPA